MVEARAAFIIPIDDSPFMVANFWCSRGVLSTRRAALTTLSAPELSLRFGGHPDHREKGRDEC